MTINKYFVAAILIALGGQLKVFAQGCSDAGVCSIDKIRPGGHMADYSNQFRAGIGYGKADHDITVIAPYLAFSRTMGKISVEGRLTAIAQNGDEASMFGLSDLFVVGNYALLDKMQISAGFKIPLANGDKMLDGQSLPMDYQPSLGTLDLLLGLNYSIKKLQLAFAYQQPLSQNNNTFLAGDFPIDSEFQKFQSTNNYFRRADVLLRISYPVKIGNKFKITPSVLPIYHLGNDRYTNLVAQEVEITGSQGLTLNANLFLDLSVGQSSSLQFNFGTPLVVREDRPDGLTRHFVVNLEYQVSF
jgi:hypothetical protein